MRNNIFTNVSGLQGGTYVIYGDTVLTENEVYQNSSNFGFDNYAFMEMNSITIRNYTFRNLNGTGSSAEYFIYLELNNGGSSIVDGLNFVNSNLGYQIGIYIQDNINNLIIKNWFF